MRRRMHFSSSLQIDKERSNALRAGCLACMCGARPVSPVYVRNRHFKLAPSLEFPHFERSDGCFKVAVALTGQGHSDVLYRRSRPGHPQRMSCTAPQHAPLRAHLCCHAEQTTKAVTEALRDAVFVLHKVKQPIAGCSQAIEAVPVVLTAVAKREHRHLPPYLRQHGPAEQTLTLTVPTVLLS